jgi:hypothetical protein
MEGTALTCTSVFKDLSSSLRDLLFKYIAKHHLFVILLLTSTDAFGYYRVPMFLTTLGNIFLSFPRCFLPGTQLPYDSNPVASGYVKDALVFLLASV